PKPGPWSGAKARLRPRLAPRKRARPTLPLRRSDTCSAPVRRAPKALHAVSASWASSPLAAIPRDGRRGVPDDRRMSPFTDTKPVILFTFFHEKAPPVNGADAA